MKIIISILISLIFALFGLLKFKGYFDLGTVNLVNIDGTFDANLTIIKHLFDYIYFLPDLIFNSEKENIMQFLSEYRIFSEQEVYISLIFFFYFTIILLMINSFKFLPIYRDKIYVILATIFTYFIIVYFIKTMANY